MALGATPSHVVKLVADEAVHLLLVGLLAGVFVTSVAERYFQSRRVLFMPNEISTWVVVLFSILIVGIAAACIPARRASRIDPNVSLRELSLIRGAPREPPAGFRLRQGYGGRAVALRAKAGARGDPDAPLRFRGSLACARSHRL